MQKHFNIKIHGSVQGVSFRYYACEKAKELGITGFVKNENDESVSIEAEGEEENVQKFVEWCRKGPVGAAVERVTVEEGKPKQYANFVIKY